MSRVSANIYFAKPARGEARMQFTTFLEIQMPPHIRTNVQYAAFRSYFFYFKNIEESYIFWGFDIEESEIEKGASALYILFSQTTRWSSNYFHFFINLRAAQFQVEESENIFLQA